ncbi:MAG: hypothetical protein HY395_01790 [Candidatus Doudnabacteria bacterium]|nr:hypothetical protein [Candidatus Doudnabacteria bacterium]
MSALIFYIFLFLHIVSLVIGFGSVIVVDTFGLLWILKRRDLAAVNRVADVTQKLIWIGWFGLVLSGTVMLTSKGFIDNLMWIKLFFVLLLGLNGIYLHVLKKAFGKFEQSNMVPVIYKFRIGLASFVSQLGWWGALTIGYLHANWQHYIPWPASPWLYIGGIAIMILATALIGEIVLRKK